MFIESLRHQFDQLPKHATLKALKQKAFDRFMQATPPEGFAHAPLKKLYSFPVNIGSSPLPTKEEVLSYVYPECRNSFFVFVDGAFIPDLSNYEALPKNVIALPTSKALRSYGPVCQERVQAALKEEKEPLLFLNIALFSEGLFLYVPPKVIIDAPLQIVHINLHSHHFSPAYIQCFLGAFAKTTMISTLVGEGMSHQLCDISLEENAAFHYFDDASPHGGWLFKYFRANLKKHSLLQTLMLTQDSRITYQNVRVLLEGEHGEALVQGLWNLSDKAEVHTQVEVKHAAPSARSLQKFKGILDDHARSSFTGEIFVAPIAQKTESYQRNNNLLLNPRAIAYTSPNLQIFADDVKASHGATVAQLNSDELFYLKSRGIDEQSAKNLLKRGFMEEILNNITIPSMRAQYVSAP